MALIMSRGWLACLNLVNLLLIWVRTMLDIMGWVNLMWSCRRMVRNNRRSHLRLRGHSRIRRRGDAWHSRRRMPHMGRWGHHSIVRIAIRWGRWIVTTWRTHSIMRRRWIIVLLTIIIHRLRSLVVVVCWRMIIRRRISTAMTATTTSVMMMATPVSIGMSPTPTTSLVTSATVMTSSITSTSSIISLLWSVV